MKKIIAIILLIVLGVTATGCNLFVHNLERDNAQVIVVINPMTFTWEEYNEQTASYDQTTYTTERYEIRKYDLISAFVNNDGASQVQQGASRAEVMTGLLDQLINRKILVEAATSIMKRGNLLVINRGKDTQIPAKGEQPYVALEDSINDINDIWRNSYTVIDNQLFLLGNQILSNLREPERAKIGAEETSTTFPIMPDFDAEAADEVEDEFEFDPRTDVSGAMISDPLYQEACVMLVRRLIGRAEEESLASADAKKLRDDKKLLDEILDLDNGKVELYYRLGEFFVIDKYIVTDQRDYQLLGRLQQYVFENTNITRGDVVSEYDDMVAVQRNLYNDLSAFATALDGSDPVLYYPQGASGYFFVRHILIPFKDEVTAELEAFKQSPFYNEQELKRRREQYASTITARAHTNGEFEGEEYTFNRIYSEILATVGSHSDNFYRERAFIEMMYKYNTDPGIFEKSAGYLIKPDGNQWADEFTEGAVELRKQGVGAIGEPVLTNFGYHILYISKTIAPTPEIGVGVDSYETAGRLVKYYDVIESKLKSNRQEANYNEFERNMFSRFKDDGSTIKYYESRYKDLL